jgi:hypothetical protein
MFFLVLYVIVEINCFGLLVEKIKRKKENRMYEAKQEIKYFHTILF